MVAEQLEDFEHGLAREPVALAAFKTDRFQKLVQSLAIGFSRDMQVRELQALSVRVVQPVMATATEKAIMAPNFIMSDFTVKPLEANLDFSQLAYWDVVIIGAGAAMGR